MILELKSLKLICNYCYKKIVVKDVSDSKEALESCGWYDKGYDVHLCYECAENESEY